MPYVCVKCGGKHNIAACENSEDSPAGGTSPLIIKAVCIIRTSSKTKIIQATTHQSILMQIDPNHNTVLPHDNRKCMQTEQE
jgi:hypothetical protein